MTKFTSKNVSGKNIDYIFIVTDSYMNSLVLELKVIVLKILQFLGFFHLPHEVAATDSILLLYTYFEVYNGGAHSHASIFLYIYT